TTQQQGDLTISPGLFSQIVINNQRVLTAVAVILADSTTGKGGEELHGSRIRSGRGHHYGVIHSAVLFQLAHHGSNRIGFLADGNVDTFNARTFLVDDGINRNRCFTALTVADDQLALATTNWHHGVNGFDPDLYRLVNRLTPNYTWCYFFDRIG